MTSKQAEFEIEEVMVATGARHRTVAAEGSVRGFSGVSTDTRSVAAGQLFVALEGERFDAHDFLQVAAEAGAAGAVVRGDHPGLSRAPSGLPLFEVEDTEVALGDLARFHRRRFEGPVVGITGSNGKTTTRALAQAALAATLGAGHATAGNLNNLIGLPLTLFGLEAGHAFSILEMGMNAPGEIARLTEIAEPGVGLVTNVAGVHLEGLGSVEGVARAKAELYQGLAPGSVAVANADDALLLPLAREAAGDGGLRLLTFGRAEGADLRLLEVQTRPDGRPRITVAPAGGEALAFGLELIGAHNAMNACSALAVVLALGGELAPAAAALESVEPVGRRLRRTETDAGATLLDDCYNANLTSMGAALETAHALAALGGGRIFAALGDMLELGEVGPEQHAELGALAARVGVERLVAFGSFLVYIVRAAAEIPHRLGTEDPTAAAAFLGGAGPGDVVLVKGSRGMRMERIVSLLEARTGEGVPA